MPKPTPPDLPPDLVNRLGPPEDVFGPNLRFRRAATLLCGLIFLIGAVGFVNGVNLKINDPRHPNASIYFLFGGMLAGTAVAMQYYQRRTPRVWAFVCPRGLARKFGDAWEGVEWAQIARAEDIAAGALQCLEVMLADRTRWNFVKDYTADYPRLVEVLLAKVNQSRGESEPRTERSEAERAQRVERRGAE